jgi:hypothetical protein
VREESMTEEFWGGGFKMSAEVTRLTWTLRPHYSSYMYVYMPLC